jgi:hypothetical protein
VDKAFGKFSVQKYSTPSKIDAGVLIYETWGKTEAKVKNGGADLGLEITQSGSAIKNYGLRIIDEVMESGTSIWVNPKIREHKQKYELLRMFLINLYGAINAENKVLLLFNVPVTNAAEVEAYLVRNNLFADEPAGSAASRTPSTASRWTPPAPSCRWPDPLRAGRDGRARNRHRSAHLVDSRHWRHRHLVQWAVIAHGGLGRC